MIITDLMHCSLNLSWFRIHRAEEGERGGKRGRGKGRGREGVGEGERGRGKGRGREGVGEGERERERESMYIISHYT
jgi:hypothetical protein